MSKEDPNPLDYTIPLFVQHPHLATGRDDRTVSASATFVKFEGQHYIVTCGHVLGQVVDSRDKTLAIMIERRSVNLYPFGAFGAGLGLRTPQADWAGRVVDVAISSIEAVWQHIVTRKHKKAVDLDNWSEPAWADVRRAVACGWLNNYKGLTEWDVSTQGALVFADVASCLSPTHPEFTLHSEKAENSETMLSGISGGLIVGELGSEEVPIGLVFEGFPGEADTLGERESGLLLQPGDLMVRGHVLTPEIFADWLRRL